MVKLIILYPNKADAKFDWDYYLKTHMPLSVKLQGEALKSLTIERGLDTSQEAVPVTFVAMTSMVYESVDSFLQAFMPHASTLQGDMPNYTNIQPVIQFNEVISQG